MLPWVHTARQLPPSQLAWWLRRRLFPPRSVALSITRPVRRSTAWDALAEEARAWHGDMESAAARRAVDHVYRFLNVERRLEKIDWTTRYVSRLWTYHLHYLDVAVDLAVAWRSTDDDGYGERFVELWTSWLDAAERGRAELEPYPTSVRCLNALESLWIVEDRLPDNFAVRLAGAVHAQLDWLSRNLERHLRANHLQRNLTALAWGSVAFEGSEARGWSRRRAELWSEAYEQILPDGVHFERAPMYHAAVLSDLLRTVALSDGAGVSVPGQMRVRLETMARALQFLSREDGTLHLFNDTANGERPARNKVLQLAARVLDAGLPEPAGSFELPAAGFFGTLDPLTGLRLVIDAGPPTPFYQPGHAHCGMLSFELDVQGRPVVVDSGVHGYDGDPFREYVRSTRAHSTVAIDGREQHETWATFRMARRGDVLKASVAETPDSGFAFTGACHPWHDRRAVHHRSLRWTDGLLVVEDRVEGAVGRPLTSWLHLHPDYGLERCEAGFIGRTDDICAPPLLIEAFGADELDVRVGERDPVSGWYCPEFGLARPAPAIELRIRANEERTFGWRLRVGAEG